MPHRFFIPPNWITSPTVTLHGETARQIKTVLRMQPGAEIVVLDNSGMAWRVRLTAVEKKEVQGKIIAPQLVRGEPALHLTLYQGTLKGPKFEWVLQKGTELGVSNFVPTICERSVVRQPDALEKKRGRWASIMREAAEQSGRGKLPVLSGPLMWPEALAQAQSAQLMLMPWEEAGGVSLKEILKGPDSLRRNENANKKSPLSGGEGMPASPPLGGIEGRLEADVTGMALFIGPEGGFTAQEAASAEKAGARLVTLGPRILRAETAALAAVAAIMYEAEAWR